jgi:hypothetical protein
MVGGKRLLAQPGEIRDENWGIVSPSARRKFRFVSSRFSEPGNPGFA